MRPMRLGLLLSVWVCALWPATSFADDECPDVEVRGRARGGGGLVGGVGGVAGDAVGGAGDVAGGVTGVDLTGGVEAALPAPTEPELEEARRLAAQARAAMAAGNLTAALPDLERAFELSRDVTLLGDLGLCLEAAGRLGAAWGAMFRFKTEARAQYEGEARARIDAAMGRIQPRLGAVRVEADVEGAEVVVGGRVIGRLPLEEAIYLDAGSQTITFRARGRRAVDVDVDVAAGATARARAELPEIDASAGDPDADLDPDANVDAGGGIPLGVWIVGGVAVVGLTVALVATGVRGSLSSDLDAEMPGTPEFDDIQGSIDTAKVWQIGAFVVAGLAVVGALLIYALVDTGSDVESNLDCPEVASGRDLLYAPRAEEVRRRRTTAFSLACTPGLLGVGCEGRF